MHKAHSSRPESPWLARHSTSLILFFVLGKLFLAHGSPSVGGEDVPVVNAKIGACSADFKVTDTSEKPIYDAKIHILLRYGFMGLHKMDLEIGTNADGKARFEGLPGKAKKPASFEVRHGETHKSVTYDPENDCHPHHDVTLGEP